MRPNVRMRPKLANSYGTEAYEIIRGSVRPLISDGARTDSNRERKMNSTDYEVRANQHRPTDLHELRAEIRRMLDSGLKTRDVAEALRMHVHDVVNIIAGARP